MRNFPCLTFQIFRIMIDAQVDDRWRVSSGSIFSKLNLTKFDKVKFQKSWHQTLMLTQSRWERSIIPWKTRYFSFFLTPKDAWQRFCLIEIWKFLEFTQGSLQERSSLLLSPISSIRPQAKLAPRSAMRGRTFQVWCANYLYVDAQTLIIHCDNKLPIDSTDLKVLYKINTVSKLAYFLDD